MSLVHTALGDLTSGKIAVQPRASNKLVISKALPAIFHPLWTQPLHFLFIHSKKLSLTHQIRVKEFPNLLHLILPRYRQTTRFLRHPLTEADT